MQKSTMRFFFSAAIALAVSGATASEGHAGEIWVTNMTSGNVQVFDSDTRKEIATIKTGAALTTSPSAATAPGRW